MANTLTRTRYGRYKTSNEADYGTVAAGQLRGCVYNALSTNAWFESIESWVGKSTGTNAVVRYGCYSVGVSTIDPDEGREGYTGVANVTASKTDATGGASYSANVNLADNSPSNSAIMGYAGKRYGLAMLATTAPVIHSMRQASAITEDNEQFYDRTGLSQPPPDPFGSFSSAVEGHITMWMNGWENVAPETPVNGLAPVGSITSLTPTFTADFEDRNGDYGDSSGLGIDTGDELKSYKIRVKRVSDDFYMWLATYTATPAEIAANAISIVYAGTTPLSRDVEYEWRVQVADAFGEYSDFSAWTSFTPVSLGYVTLDDVPTGQQAVITGIDFKGRWNHTAATTMKTCMVRILDTSLAVLQTGSDYNIADVASSALPGTLFTIPWASSGLVDFSWGREMYYQIRGYDGSSWSSWSDPRSFNTDFAPVVPTSLTPDNNDVQNALPLLEFSMTDADDTTGTGLTAVIRITRPDTSTVDVTPTYNVSTEKWEFQTTVTELSAYGTFSWTATGYDGTLYSGEATVLGSATWATAALFEYAAGPTVTVTSPTNNSTVTTASIPVTWTVSTTQVSYQVTVYANDDSDTLIYDSGTIISALTSHTIPSGYLYNDTDYDFVVHVVDTAPLDGYSPTVNIRVEYPPADPPAAFSAVAIKVGDDAFETAIRLYWEQTTYSSPEFISYVIKRSASGGPDVEEIRLKRFSSPTRTTYTDFYPASDYEYTYSLTINILTGEDTIESTELQAVETLHLEGVILNLISNAGTYRSCLVNVTARDHTRMIQETLYQSVAETKPVSIRNKARYWEWTLAGYLIDTTESTAQEKYEDLIELDEQNGTICYRDGRGLKRFGKIVDLVVKDELPDFYSFTMKLREERVTEGVI